MSGLVRRRCDEREPVVITGLAAVSPLGSTVDTILDRLFAGVSGVREIEIDPRARTDARFAAPVTEIPRPAGIEPEEFARLDRLEQLCLSPVAGALADAGIDRSPAGPRIGLVLGLGAEQLKVWELDFLAAGTAVFESRRDPTIVHRLAARTGITGPAVTAAAACASSGYALALARAWIDAGWVDASPAAATSSARLRSPPSTTSGPCRDGPTTRPRPRGRSTATATAS
jgi:3-oxoacyl-[acyl-carrier-protein] synthase II